MKQSEVAALIEHAVLRPFVTEREVKIEFLKCVRYGVGGICVYPVHVPGIKSLQSYYPKSLPRKIKIVTVIGFPIGGSSTQTKVHEIYNTLADEYDVVIAGHYLRDKQYFALEDELQRIVCAADGHPVKAILEVSRLTPRQVAFGCEIACDAGVSFIKTATGFGLRNTRPSDVQRIADIIRTAGYKDIGIKAAGGIRTPEHVRSMLAAGATRVGCSNTFSILDNWPKKS